MRLDPIEKKALEQSLKEVPYPVYLVGSRTDDRLKGGDIDILIEVSDSLTDRYQLSKDIERIFFNHCEEKLDIIIIDPQNLSQSEKIFLNTLKNRIKIKDGSAT